MRALAPEIRDDHSLAGPSRRASGLPSSPTAGPDAQTVSRFGASTLRAPEARASEQSEAVTVAPLTATHANATPASPFKADVASASVENGSVQTSGVTAGERPGTHSPRAPAALSAASSRRSLRVLPDRHLMDLATACDQAADPILQSATDMERVCSAAPGWTGISAAAADRLARGSRLKEAAQHLRQDAHDADLQRYLAHREAGGTVLLLDAQPVVGGDECPAEAVSLVQRLGRALRRPFERWAA